MNPTSMLRSWIGIASDIQTLQQGEDAVYSRIRDLVWDNADSWPPAAEIKAACDLVPECTSEARKALRTIIVEVVHAAGLAWVISEMVRLARYIPEELAEFIDAAADFGEDVGEVLSDNYETLKDGAGDAAKFLFSPDKWQEAVSSLPGVREAFGALDALLPSGAKTKVNQFTKGLGKALNNLNPF